MHRCPKTDYRNLVEECAVKQNLMIFQRIAQPSSDQKHGSAFEMSVALESCIEIDNRAEMAEDTLEQFFHVFV